MPTMSGSEVTFQECDAIEEEIAALKVAYEHYFLGTERVPPTRQYEDLKKRVMRLKGSFVRNTSAKFRVQSIHGKFVTYERLWQRTMQEIENGTYKRDVVKARRRIEKKPGDRPRTHGSLELPDDELDSLDGPSQPVRGVPSVAPLVPSVAPLVPSVAPVAPAVKPLVPSVAPLVPSVAPLVPSVAPVAPAVKPLVPSVAPVTARPAAPPRAAAPAARPAAASGSSDLSDARLKSVYDAYVAAKRNNKEDTSKMSYDSVAASLRKQVPELMKQHKASAVEFKVVIKDGKAVLKAVPK
ncbi:MXAN_5187 C-terminal domain-containing protein [Cystobacter fuscus]